MQRKNRILNHRRGQHRTGFAMIMAIFFMILMATLMTYMLESTADTTKRTINDYIMEQAQLVAKSSVEYAILQVSDQNRSNLGCLTDLTITYPASGLEATVAISYFGFRSIGVLDSCTNLLPLGTDGAGVIQSSESNGTMLIDVYVKNDGSLGLTEPISFHRRTLQKL